MSISTISPEILRHLDPGKYLILDVRTPMEHAEKRLKRPHQHVPLDVLNPVDFMIKSAENSTTKIYLLCRTGQRSKVAAEKFLVHGYDNIFVIEGGIVACETCGHDMEGYNSPNRLITESKTYPIPLERQVRIAAGAFVAIGVVLSLLVNIWFCLISLFVGCGLIFSGVTDRCGMALILTKAPWNKVAKSIPDTHVSTS
ncbi:MAG: rhodanese-like domain-containing protein [Alphaproteobacteria bacterium]|nr:rhodanese-like domain-containing protein [Alphaproteobacteria bacterium]